MALPHDVPPGDSVELRVQLSAPSGLASGSYRLAWGMLQQDVLWFHDRGFPDAETTVRLEAASLTEQGSEPILAPVR